MSVKRQRLGSWTCPSGNNVVAYYQRDQQQVGYITMEGDVPPPLDPEDELFYRVEIVPAIDRHIHEITETLGDTSLWVRPRP